MDTLRKIALLLLISGALGAACSGPSQTSAQQEVFEDESCMEISREVPAGDSALTTAYPDRLYQSGNQLFLEYHYSGCRKVEPALYALPIQGDMQGAVVPLRLRLPAAGWCEMLIRDTLCVNLSALPYQTTLRSGKILVNDELSLNFNID